MTACFDIGGSFIRYGASNESGLVFETGRSQTPTDDFNAFVGSLEAGLEAMNTGASEPVSISICGYIDPVGGVATIANVPCVNGRALAVDLSAHLDRPVYVANDADCFALAEARHGVGRGHDNIFAIILGSGVGGGLVINGQLVAGTGGIAGEWGHGPIVDPGAGGLTEPMRRKVCGCGRTDCLDPVGSARGLEYLHQLLHDQRLSSLHIAERFGQGDVTASRTVEIYVENLARVLAMIVNVTGVTTVPVGGGLAAAKPLIAALDKRTRELALADFLAALVVPGDRAADGGLIGAAILAETGGEVAP